MKSSTHYSTSPLCVYLPIHVAKQRSFQTAPRLSGYSIHLLFRFHTAEVPNLQTVGGYSSCSTNSQSFAISLGPSIFSIRLASANRAIFQTLVFITSSELPAATPLKIHVTGKSLPYPAIHRNLPSDLNPLYLLL